MSSVQPPAVLFVCTFNRVRSPMAAGLMHMVHGGDATIDSCGLEPGADVDPFAAAVMAEVGVDLLGHTPQTLGDLLADGRFTHIVTLSEEARLDIERRSAAARVMNWPIADPTLAEGSRETRLEAYRLTRRQLQAFIAENFGARRARAVGS